MYLHFCYSYGWTIPMKLYQTYRIIYYSVVLINLRNKLYLTINKHRNCTRKTQLQHAAVVATVSARDRVLYVQAVGFALPILHIRFDTY